MKKFVWPSKHHFPNKHDDSGEKSDTLVSIRSKMTLFCCLCSQILRSEMVQAADGTIDLLASMTFTFLVLPLSLGSLSAYVLLGKGSFHTIGKVNLLLANLTIWIYFAFLGGPQSEIVSLILFLPAFQIYFILKNPGLESQYDFGFVKIGKKIFVAIVVVPHLMFSHFMYRSFYLRQAATYGHESIAEILMSVGADPKDAALVYLAAKRGHSMLAKRFIDLGASPERLVGVSLMTYEFLAHLARSEWGEAQIMLPNLDMEALQDDQGEGPLHILSKGRQDSSFSLEIAKMLLDQGLSSNLRDLHGDTALIQAVEAGHEQMVDLLLSNGADQAIRGAGFNNLNAFERVLQKNRQRSRDLRIFDLFVSNGWNLASRDLEGRTALMQVVLAKNLKIGKKLIALGVDVNSSEQKHGRTALFFLVGHLNRAHENDSKILEMLLNHGADPRHKDHQGRDVYTLFSTLKRNDLLSILNEHKP